MITVSKLIKILTEYKNNYGDNTVTIYNRDTNEDLEIITFDRFTNELNIEVGYIVEEE